MPEQSDTKQPREGREEILPLREGHDYVLPEDRQSVWITVGNISVYIKREDEGAVVDLYPLNDEMAEPLAGAWATFVEAAPDSPAGERCECGRWFTKSDIDGGRCLGCARMILPIETQPEVQSCQS